MSSTAAAAAVPSPALVARRVLAEDGHAVRAFAGPWHAGRPTVVFVLPFGVRVEIARGFLAELALRFNVLTWEARIIIDDPAMHADVAQLTPHMHVEDLVSVLAAFDAGRTDVIGYCSGAGIALLAAQRYPDRVRRIALVSGEYVLPSSACPRTRFQADVDALLPLAARGREQAAAVFSRLAVRPAIEDAVAEAARLAFSRPEYLHRLALNYVSYRQVDFLAVAASIGQPAMVAVGGRDEQVTVPSSQLIHGRLRDSRFHFDAVADHHDVCRGGTPIGDAVLRFLG